MSELDPIIYTQARIVASEKVPDIVHIHAEDLVGNILIVLTQDEFVSELKRWLRMRPMETRQEVIDELTACTLRTLEVEQ